MAVFTTTTPPFTSLLPHREPTDEETLAASRFIAEGEQELVSLVNQITQLLVRKHRMEVVLSQHRAFISVINRVPTELWSKIFVMCKDAAGVERQSDTPITLSLACRAWRRIALATPQLWSSVDVGSPPLDTRDNSSNIRRFEEIGAGIEQWLTRAAAVPLDVTINWNEADCGRRELYQTVAEPILKRAKQVAKISFKAPFDLIDTASRYLKREDVPLLHTVDISCYTSATDPRESRAPAPWLSFLHTPSIRHFSYANFTNTRGTQSLMLPDVAWSQLSSLSLASSTGTFFRQVEQMCTTLAQCKNLTKCTIQLPGIRMVPGGSGLSLLALEELCLQSDPWGESDINMVNFLSSLTSPHLKHLSLHGPCTFGPPAPTIIPGAALQFINRSKCELESLSLHLPYSLEETFGLLKANPKLKTLRLWNDWFSSERVADLFCAAFAGFSSSLDSPKAVPESCDSDSDDWSNAKCCHATTTTQRTPRPPPKAQEETAELLPNLPLCPLLQHLDIGRVAPSHVEKILRFIERRNTDERPEVGQLQSVEIYPTSLTYLIDDDGYTLKEAKHAVQTFVERGSCKVVIRAMDENESALALLHSGCPFGHAYF